MANKRQLKRSIKFICGDVAGECLFSEFAMQADGRKMSQIIVDLADLQDDTIRKVSVAFDKSAGSSKDKKEYKKAKRNYYKKAYSTLKQQFNEGLEGIVKDINSLIPQEQKEQNKKQA